MNTNNQNALFDAANSAMQNAYCPYSKFQVGCAIRASNGKIYHGCNIENVSYGLTLCAEGAAIAAMISDGQRQITEIAIIASSQTSCYPCGACRQRLTEFAQQAVPIHLYANQYEVTTLTLGELLPHAFGPELNQT